MNVDDSAVTTMQSPDADRAPVTVIGLGLMGQALAGAFLRDGHVTTIWNRTAAKAEPLVARGARRTDSVREAVAASPLVVVCVSDYTAVHELLDPLGDVLPGRVLVNLTSGTPQMARATAEWAARCGCTYLDGAILAVPSAVGADAVILYSGPRSAFDLYGSALRSLGAGSTYVGGDHGLSSLYDVAMLSVMWNTINGFLQGVALLGAADVDAATFAPTAIKGIVTVTDWLPGYANQIDSGSYPAIDSTIDTHLAAMEHLIHESDVLGVSAGLPRFIKALTEQAVADGHGGDSYAAMIEQFRKP